MSDYFSYIDTALRIIYINKRSNISEQEQDNLRKMLNKAETSMDVKDDLVKKHIEYQFNNDPNFQQLLVHEVHHYFQGLFYPFLYYLNWIEFNNLMLLNFQIRNGERQSFEIDQIGLLGKYKGNATYTTRHFCLYWTDKDLWMKTPGEGDTDTSIFSLYDMIEDVTTIFQYKLNEKFPTAEGFQRYIQNPSNNCYKRLYRFIVKKLGIKYTFDLLPMLVQIAFTTTSPIYTFCHAVNLITHEFPLYENMGIKELYEHVLRKLSSDWGTYTIDPENDVSVEDLSPQVLLLEDIEAFVNFTYDTPGLHHYPLSLHALKLIKLSKEIPDLFSYLFTIDKSKYDFLLKEFYPFAIHFHLLEMNGRNSIAMIGTDYSHLRSKTPSNEEYRDYIKELVKLKEVTQGLLTKVQESIPSLCHHVTCKFYNFALCKNWNSVPLEYDSCGFPDWFTFIFLRKINIEQKTLDKISESEGIAYFSRYHELSYKERKFHYVKTDKGYTLTISKRNIKHGNKTTMFADFIEFLTLEEKISKDSLFYKISFKFYEFENDIMPLFEIPEIVAWIQATYKIIPEMFCFMNVNDNENQSRFLLPALIKHTKTFQSENIFRVFYDPADLQGFMKQQITIFENMHKNHPNINQELFFKTLYLFLNGS